MGLFKGEFYSASLKMTTGINVIFPDHSNDVDPVIEGEPKVLYLLHGLAANVDEWIRFSKIEYYAKKYNFVVIMPEVQRSFYCNNKLGINYFDYVADELPQICKKWLNINTTKENTFIAGESMGGYGAVKIGLSRPNQYQAIASLSGVLDYEDFSKMVHDGKWPDMDPRELDILEDQITPIELVKVVSKLKEKPEIIQLCGTSDFLYEGNQNFLKVMEENAYPHLYLEGPGDHEWPYWDKAIQYAFMYFLKLDMKNTPLY